MSRPVCGNASSASRTGEFVRRAVLARIDPPRREPLLQMLLDLLVERGLRIGPDERVHVTAVPEEKNTRNRANVEAHAGLLVRIDVDLRDLDLPRVLTRQLLEDGGDGVTGAAPGGPKIDQ